MLETPQKTPQFDHFEGKTPQFTPQKKRQSYRVIQQSKGVTLIARPTAKGRISYALVIYEGGKRLRKTLFAASERDAQAKAKAVAIYKESLDKLQKGLMNETTIAFEREDFFQFMEQLIPSRKPVSQKSWKGTLRHLRLWHGARPLAFRQLTKAACLSFRNYLQSLIDKGEMRRNTANLNLSRFKTAVKEAVKYDLLPYNPATVLESFESEPTRAQALTIAELHQLFDTPEPQMRGVDSFALKAYVLFSVRTGLRPSDARRLCWNDIRQSENGTFYFSFVPSKTRRKNPTEQVIPIHDDVVKMLIQLKMRIPNFDGARPIFEMLPRKESDAITKWLRKWSEAAKIAKHLTLYSLRHSYASQLVELKVPIYEVAKLLTHTDVRHTQRYGRVLESAKVEAVQSLPSIFTTKPTENLN
jgi:integrase